MSLVTDGSLATDVLGGSGALLQRANPAMDPSDIATGTYHPSPIKMAADEIISGFGIHEERRKKPLEVLVVEAFSEIKPPRNLIKDAQPTRHRLDAAIRLVKTTKPSTLDLSEAPLGDAGVTELCDALLGHAYLVELRLRAVGVGLSGTHHVAELIGTSMRLKHLELSHNKSIGNNGACRLADALRASRALARLELAGCGVGDVGAVALAAALTSRRSAGPLKHLDLALSPDLGSEGAEALRDAATKCRQLSTLDLSGTGAPPPLVTAAQLACRPEGKANPTGAELWESGVHSAFTLRWAPPTDP